MTDNIRQRIIKPNESLVLEYFQRVKSSDVPGLLNLFSDDSVIYEPFSKSKCLTGRSEIESFLRTVIMANKGMQHEIKIEKERRKANKNQIVALVTFHKGDSMKARFTFEFERADELNCARIKTLYIEFIDE